MKICMYINVYVRRCIVFGEKGKLEDRNACLKRHLGSEHY